MKRRTAPFMFLITLLLFVGSYVVLRIPEARAVPSDDGALTVTGLARSSDHIAVSVDDNARLGDPLLGLVYHIEPNGVPLSAPLTLSFSKKAALGTEDATAVYQWNSALGMWVPIASTVAETSDVLAVEVMSLGDFALGTEPIVEVPSLLSAQDAIRTKAPVGTRGFRLSTSYTLPEGVPVAWPEVQVLGGCGGRVGSGDRAEYSSQSQTIHVDVDDVQTPVEFTIVGEWIVAGDGTGCGASMPLRDQM